MMSYPPNGVDPNTSRKGLLEDDERVFSRGWLQLVRSAIAGYGLAFVSVSGALVLAQVFLYYGLPHPFTALAQPFTPLALSAIAITFWYGGTKPGILAALIAWLVHDDLFEPQVSAESRHLLYGLVFLVFALVMILVKRGRSELEAGVAERTAELTKTNEDLRAEIARHEATAGALRRSEAYLAEAQRLSHTGTWAFDKAATLYWSDESYRIWGFDPLQGLPNREVMWERVHPDDRVRVHQEVHETLRQQRDYAGEFRILLPDGRIKYLQATSHHVFSESGDLIEALGTNVDVTERKGAEDALRASEAKIRRLVDANIIGILIWDFDGRVLEANKAFLDIVGYDHKDLVAGRIRWTDLTPPEWRDQDARLIQEHVMTGRLQPFEKEYFRKDGSRVPVLIGVATFEEGGNQGVAFVLNLTERKRAEHALRESEYKLRQIVETVPSLLWSLAPDGEPTHFNQRLLDYFGKSFEDFKHAGWGPFVHPDDLAETEKTFSHAIQTGTSYQGVLRLRRADGAYRWHQGRAEPLRDQQGRIVQWYGLTVDIDESKKVEDRLRRSEALLAEAQRLSHSGVSVYQEATILHWSEETYRIWGFDPAQGVPSREAVFQRIHPDERDQVRAHSRRLFAEKKGYSIGFRIALPDGTTKYLESISEPVVFARGEIVEAVATHVDVTERKRAEEALRESEYKLRQIVETIPSLVWSADPNFEVTHLNQRHLDYYGKQLEDFKRGDWKAVHHPDDLTESAKAISHAVQTGTSFHAVHRIRRADGEFRWHDSRAEPLRDRQGNIIQWYGLTVDIDEARKAEERLRRSEAYLAEAQALSHAGSAVYNETAILYFSDETYRIFGFDPREGLPSREAALERIHPGDLARVREEARKAVEQKTDHKLEYRILLPSGIIKYIESNAYPKFSKSGELSEVVSTIIDVTERKRAEEALREREAKIRRLVDANIIGIFIWDFEGGIIEANDAFLRIVDYDREDLVSGRIRWTEVTPPELRERDERAVAELRATGTFQPFEKEYLRKDGSRIPVLIGGALFEESGSEGVAFVLDLTKRKRAEEALRESEGKFRDYAETASDWFWEIGPDYKFTLLTENAFGSRPDDRIGTFCWDHALDLETEPEKWRFIQATLDSRKPFRDFVYCSAGAASSPMYVKASGKPVFDASGEFRGYRGTASDVTAIMRAHRAEASLRTVQAELAHASRVTTLGQLTASIAHEITQPIATARNNARAAANFLDKLPPNLDEVREALDCIVADADRAGDIIDRIRDHIKKAPPRHDCFDLNAAINEVIVLARSEIAKNGVLVHTHLTGELPPIKGDRVQLQQVMMNLILNAVEAMSSVEAGARELLITAEQDQANCVVVTVRDSGPGIDPGQLGRVFEAFYTTKSSGVGIGLSICRSIIEAHGGRLWAEANESRGAAFKFTLPSAEEELMTSDQARQRNGEPYEDRVADPSRQPACEGNK